MKHGFRVGDDYLEVYRTGDGSLVVRKNDVQVIGVATCQIASELLKLAARVAELEAWKAEAMAVDSQWDPQAVGRLLDIPLGTLIRPGIQPGIERLLADVARKEQALRFIEQWRLPKAVARDWTDVNAGKAAEPREFETTYEAAYGSNGAREFMRNVARAALSTAPRDERDTLCTKCYGAGLTCSVPGSEDESQCPDCKGTGKAAYLKERA